MTRTIFERATKQKLRFPSNKGLLTVEQIWELSLTDLDKLARAVSKELKSLTEDSFIEVTPDPRKTEFKLQLDILKHVIASKLEDQDVAAKRVEKANKRRALLEALDSKENEEIQKLSKEDILKQLEDL